jgi:hypothetical protein
MNLPARTARARSAESWLSDSTGHGALLASEQNDALDDDFDDSNLPF